MAQLYRNMYVHSHFATSSKLEEDPLFARIRGEGLKREALTLVEALRQLAGGSVQIKDGVVRDANGDPLETGLDITQQIEDLLAEQADA